MGAFAGAGLLIGAAVARRSRAGTVTAILASLPLVYRGLTGRWPVPRSLAADSVVVMTRLVIQRTPIEVYEAWRAFERLPSILRHVDRVELLGDRLSRWVARVPGGARVEWTAEIVEDQPGRVLVWRSIGGSAVQQLGSLHFDHRPEGGTLLRADLRLLPRAGPAGVAVAALLQPLLEREIREDLRRFKHIVEAGETPAIEGQPPGRRGLLDLHDPL